ncbi:MULTISPECIES: hypothetical protein [Novosphingobium]|uniref:hypothetical protein n=1 Tax=Novosphingobium TaxID=165696 RepID=UPI0022F28492|nr:hypothetical protein [Novosphingobium resinovorum]GLK44479.1 hypothetical protein GCM10017612_23990 [Novosphingobium resinovorum]
MTDAKTYFEGPAILVDRSPFGGFEVEPRMCPAASGKGSWFSNYADAHEYADALALEAGAKAIVLCDAPQEGAE